MIVYVLKGSGSRGKTTTLKLLLYKLLNRNKKIKVLYSKPKIYEDVLLKEIDDEKLYRKDGVKTIIKNYRIIVELNGKIIGVYTAGDTKKHIEEAIEFFNNYHCDIGFCACRSKGCGANILKKEFGKNLTIVKKAEINNAETFIYFNDYVDALNEWQAEELYKKI